MTATAPAPDPLPAPPAWTRFGQYRRPGRFPPAKRALDLVLVLATAPIWLPILALTALAVRLRLGTPILFTQERPGLLARPFRLLKFRSMSDARNPDGSLLPDAQRLPAFGRRLRASSLDELPSLLCVLRGSLSLVGPRPLLAQYLPLYSPEQARRHDMPPGLTGWAQVHGRNTLSWERKFELDLWYVHHASLGLDLWILAQTCLTVLRRDGINAPGEATMPPFRGSPPPASPGT